ncbi:MAG: TIGR04282 family arsenosugar biosynthesis glycosyltransferase [Gammaproteobacteria bacterium]
MRRDLILFAKPPVAGTVKTRLIPTLGVCRATKLYVELLRRTIDAATQIVDVKKHFHISGSPEHEFFRQFPGWTFNEQVNGDLGGRMRAALNHHADDSTATVLIGGDILDLTVTDLARAFESLERGFDFVLGPSYDGGYWLVGSRSKSQPIFNNIDWSTPRVFSQTRAALIRNRLTYHCLPIRRDLDEAGDISYLNSLSSEFN